MNTFTAGFREKLNGRFNEAQAEMICNLLEEYTFNFDIKPICTAVAPSVYTYPPEINLFLAVKKQDGKMSEKSRALYEYTLKDMHMFLQLPVDKITTMHLRLYLDYSSTNKITGQRVSKATLNNRKYILRSYFQWLVEEEMIAKNPALRIKPEKDDAIPREAFTDTEIEKIRNVCSCARDKAIVDLLTSSGIRVSELVNLDRSSIDLEKRELKVFGKGSKWRTAYMDGRALVSISEYLKTRTDNSKALFVTEQKPHDRITTQGIRYMLHSLSDASGVDNVIPHRFRHTLATASINAGMPIESVQQMLGHEKIDTTMHYAHVAKDKVKQDYNRFVR